MTSILLKSPAASFPAGLRGARIPYLADCLGYFRLGISNTESIINRVVPGADLTLVGGGAAGFSGGKALITNTQGFQTPFTVTPYNCTAIIVCDSPTDTAGGSTVVVTSLYPLSATSGNGLSFYNSGGDQVVFTTSGGGSISTVSGRGLYPVAGRQEFRALVENGTTASLIGENGGGGMVTASGTVSNPARSATQMKIGAGGFATSYSYASAAAFFNRPLSAAECLAVRDFIFAENVARGIAS